MTYLPFISNPSSNKSQGSLGVPANLNVNTRIPCTSVTHTGITNSSGQLVISSGLSVLLTASAFLVRGTTGGYLVYQWYDVTNSAWLGRACQISTAKYTDNNHRYRSQSFARCVLVTTAQTTVELRIKSILNTSRINELNDGSTDFTGRANPWYSILSF